MIEKLPFDGPIRLHVEGGAEHIIGRPLAASVHVDDQTAGKSFAGSVSVRLFLSRSVLNASCLLQRGGANHLN